MNYSELNFFKNNDSIHGIMTFEEFNSLAKRLDGKNYEKRKLFNLFRALSYLQDYILESPVQVTVIYPTGAKYEFTPPYVQQMPDILGLTDKYQKVALNFYVLLDMAIEHYKNQKSKENSAIELLDIDDYVKENFEVDHEPVMVSKNQVEKVNHMVSSDRLKNVEQILNNQYSLDSDEY